MKVSICRDGKHFESAFVPNSFISCQLADESSDLTQIQTIRFELQDNIWISVQLSDDVVYSIDQDNCFHREILNPSSNGGIDNYKVKI